MKSKCHTIFHPQIDGIRRRKNVTVTSEVTALRGVSERLGPPM